MSMTSQPSAFSPVSSQDIRRCLIDQSSSLTMRGLDLGNTEAPLQPVAFGVFDFHESLRNNDRDRATLEALTIAM